MQNRLLFLVDCISSLLEFTLMILLVLHGLWSVKKYSLGQVIVLLSQFDHFGRHATNFCLQLLDQHKIMRNLSNQLVIGHIGSWFVHLGAIPLDQNITKMDKPTSNMS